MPRYRVLMSWTDDQGEHKYGDTVTLPADSPAEQAEVARLIEYGVIEPATQTAGRKSTKDSDKD